MHAPGLDTLASMLRNLSPGDREQLGRLLGEAAETDHGMRIVAPGEE